MDFEDDGTSVEVQVPSEVQPLVEIPEKKARVRKPKAPPMLILPVPTQVDGTKNITLSTAIEKRFARIVFYDSTKPGAKPYAVVLDKTNPKVVKSVGTAMENFINTVADAALGGAGMSGDGSALYASDNYKKVLASAPKFGGYVLELVPAGRAGLQSYRATVDGWMRLIETRAGIVRSSMKVTGTKHRTVREIKAQEPSKVQVVF